MSSIFSSLIGQREIQKKVDSIAGDYGLDTPQAAIKTAVRENRIKASSPDLLATDVLITAKDASIQIQRILDEVVSTNSYNSMNTVYFEAVALMNFNPARMLSGTYPVKASPPLNALKIVERAVYRTQTDPRAILVKDLYRTQAQVGAIEYAYESSWNDALKPNNLIGEIIPSTLSNLVLMKDKQFAQLALDQARSISKLTNPGLTDGFFENLAEMVYTASNSISRLGSQLEHLSLGRIDEMFDEYSVLDQTIDTVNGDMVDFAYQKMLGAKDAAIYFGAAPEILKITDNLEQMGDPTKPVRELSIFRNELDKRLLTSLRNIERNLVTIEGKILQTVEVRNTIQRNLENVWIVKDMMYASSTFGDFTNLDFSNPTKIATSITSVLERLRGVAAMSRKIRTPKFNNKELAASTVLSKWVESVKKG